MNSDIGRDRIISWTVIDTILHAFGFLQNNTTESEKRNAFKTDKYIKQATKEGLVKKVGKGLYRFKAVDVPKRRKRK